MTTKKKIIKLHWSSDCPILWPWWFMTIMGSLVINLLGVSLNALPKWNISLRIYAFYFKIFVKFLSYFSDLNYGDLKGCQHEERKVLVIKSVRTSTPVTVLYLVLVGDSFHYDVFFPFSNKTALNHYKINKKINLWFRFFLCLSSSLALVGKTRD